MTRINDYLFTHSGFQLFHVSYIFRNLEKSIKYSMHWISKRLNDILECFIRENIKIFV